jgi:hypothetical protein
MAREVERQDNVKKINNEFGMIQDFATLGATPPTTLDVDHMAASGNVHNDFAVAYSSAVKAFEKEKSKASVNGRLPSALDLKDNSDQMANFGKYMKGVMESEDKQGISNVLTDAMKDAAKGKFSQDKLKITMFYALQRGNLLDAVMDGVKSVDPALLKIDGGMKSLLEWSVKTGIKDPQLASDYLDAIKNNAEPAQAVQVAIKNSALKNNPTIVSIPANGQTRIDKFGNRAIVYPDGHWEELTGKKESK